MGAVMACADDGQLSVAENCALDCGTLPVPHCLHLVPQYLPDVCESPAASDQLVFATSSSLDLDVDATCNGGIVTQSTAPDICVVRYKTIKIESTATLAVVSAVQNRALAFVADDLVDISGVLDLSASSAAHGAGAITVASGGSNTAPDGGGGAGFATAGGAGGNGSSNGGAANGGVQRAVPLAALVGGANGGGTGGGGGGGAATLVSCKGTVSLGGIVATGGGGGAAQTNLPGAGGGAGGYVAFQGIAVTIVGEVYANGGGGAGGAAASVSASQNGEDAKRSDSVYARGGGISGLTIGHGGVGGLGGVVFPLAPGDGQIGNGTLPAGGGGGSVGYFQSFTPGGVTPTLTPSHASPSLEANQNVATR